LTSRYRRPAFRASFRRHRLRRSTTRRQLSTRLPRPSFRRGFRLWRWETLSATIRSGITTKATSQRRSRSGVCRLQLNPFTTLAPTFRPATRPTRNETVTPGAEIGHRETNRRPRGRTNGGRNMPTGTDVDDDLAAGRRTDLANGTIGIAIGTGKSANGREGGPGAGRRDRRPAATGTSTRRTKRTNVMTDAKRSTSRKRRRTIKLFSNICLFEYFHRPKPKTFNESRLSLVETELFVENIALKTMDVSVRIFYHFSKSKSKKPNKSLL